MKKSLYALAFIACLLLAGVSAIACSGSAGPQGEQGPAGPSGKLAASYVGSASCEFCHEDQFALWDNSGHKYKLTKVVDGVPPEYPYTEVLEPPEGYTWADISYVIGGYNWKARFIDQEGYIITGADETATTQYNFANPDVGTSAGWVGYHAGEVDKPFDCGRCHTTGYDPEGHQDDLFGLIGTWQEDGIACEECHGPASKHIDDPYGVKLLVDRDAEACGSCHIRDSYPEGKTEIDASGGFIRHHEQYEELFQTRHYALDCVDCHDPHTGVIQGRKEAGIATVNITCGNCHYEQAATQSSAIMKNSVDCIDCHMPRIVKSAVGDADAHTGDIRTHLFAIDPNATDQFSEDGSTAISQITLDWACKSCHRTGGIGLAYDDITLRAEATGYHE